ncbi:RdRP-domain-containing protein [Jackrogersella minutella]|nr:RdRP-domain-containing protein [Jackrogersella minutella]
MDVFMTNLPIDLTENSLKTQLTPFITENLGITAWTCQKNRGKNFGIVTFLHSVHGEEFLQVHGELNRRARLILLDKPIICRRGRKPDPFLLRTILEEDQRQMVQDDDEQPVENGKNVAFNLRGLSCGHYEYPGGTFTYTADIDWSGKNMECVAKFARDYLVITFTSHDGSMIRVEVPYRIVYEIIVTERPTSFTLTLQEAPRFFQVTGGGNRMQSLNSSMSTMGISGTRTNRTTMTRLSQLPHINGNHLKILGQSLVYRIQVSPADFHSKLRHLKEKEKLNFSYFDFPEIQVGRTYMADGLQTFRKLVDACNAKSIVPFDVLFQFEALVRNGYLLPQTAESLLRRIESSGARKNAASMCPFSAGAVKKLFSQIPFPGPDVEASTFSPNEIWSYLEKNEKNIRRGTAEELVSERIGRNLVMVYKVQVTPTRISFLGPEAEAKNRILRKFPHHIGFFARVQFCEEDGQDLYSNSFKVSFDQVWARFKAVLMNGVHIAGREYKFLGFSHSSLRAHGVWFMAPFVDHNSKLQGYFSVISNLGRFNNIYSPSRCAARIGQAFSETPFAVDLEALGTDIQYVNDVKSSDGSRVFSDGVGTLSRSLMEAINAALPQGSDNTTCFQIRWAGAKGMLSLDDTLQGTVMRIRDSMVKFESEDKQFLEICDMGKKPIPLVLNRQMIKILEDMGVSDKWFLQLQERELTRLREITASTDNTVTFLKRHKVAEQINFSRFIRRLKKLGIDYKKDAFLCSVVETVVLMEVRLLKHKTRIPVEKGVTLFGVMDEFDFLGEDEVFITFDKDELPKTRQLDLHNQLVLVTRSPALHPGDIQIRRAVVPPDYHPLHALSNCIAFSQKGQRDLPSQLSGGDLDGDIYNIIWDRDAVNSLERQFAPADYPRVSPKNIGREVNQEDMTDFFVEFMATDQLGVIATRHIILADMKYEGTADKECKELAELHSIGVDYSKSGNPIDMGRLRNLTRPKCRPDFLAPAPPAKLMNFTEVQFEVQNASVVEDEDDDDGLKYEYVGLEKILGRIYRAITEVQFEVQNASVVEDEDDDDGPKYRYYGSEKILGRLYRAIDEKKVWKQDIHRTVNRNGASVWTQLFSHIRRKCVDLEGVNWQAAEDEARRIREAYDGAIWSSTMDYSDNFTKGLTELEVFTGCIFNKSGVQTRRQRDKSVRLKDDYDRIAKWVEGLIRKKGVQVREDDENHSDSDGESVNHRPGELDLGYSASALELSIACLSVGMTESNNFGRANNNFQSFKIVAAQCALTELTIARAQHEIAVGADLVAGSAKFPSLKK